MRRREREERRQYMKSRRRKRIQQIQYTEQQERHFGVMENNPVMDEFDLLALQRIIRCELRDRRVRLTQGKTEGRVNLEIKGHVLTNILDQLRGKKTWSHEKKLMVKEICALKNQLSKGQSKIHFKAETKEMKSQIQMLCKRLSLTLEELDVEKSNNKHLEKALNELPIMNTEEVIKYLKSLEGSSSESQEDVEYDLEEQISKTKYVQVKLEKMEAENKELKERLMKIRDMKDMEMEALQKLMEDAKKAAERNQTALKKAEDLLETERICWQQEKSSLLEEMEKSRALHVAQKKHNSYHI